jgi:hypothetical protein
MYDGCRIPVPEGVAVAMGFRADTQLSIGYWTDPNRLAPIDAVELIVSSIPFEFWADIYECSIPLNHRPGSSANAADALAALHGNILQSESTALGLMQTGYWTVITEFKSAAGSPPTEEEFREHMVHWDAKQPFLSQAPNASQDIFLRKLSRLAQCAERIAGDAERKGQYAGSSIVLHGDTVDRLEMEGLFRTEHSRYVFLAADTEERMLTLCFPRGKRKLYHINLVLSWQHAEIPPLGLFGEVARVLTDARLNILRSYNYTMKKDRDEEVSALTFIVEGPAFLPGDLKELQARLSAAKHKGIAFVKSPGLTVASDLWKASRQRADPLIVIPEEVRTPKCFLARLSSKKQGDLTNRVRAVIRDNGFLPWEVDPAAIGKDFVAGAVLEQIRHSCCVVMLIEKHEYLRQRGSGRYEQTVSPWLIAEDAMAQALGIHVFRLKENSVTHETFNRGANFIAFDKGHPDDAILELDQAMKGWKASESFIRQLRAATRRSMEEYLKK